MSIVFNRARPRDSRLNPLRMWRILGSTIFTSFFFCERFVFMHPHFGASKARVRRCKAARARVCTYLCRQRDWFEWDRTAPFKRGQRVRAARPCYRGDLASEQQSRIGISPSSKSRIASQAAFGTLRSGRSIWKARESFELLTPFSAAARNFARSFCCRRLSALTTRNTGETLEFVGYLRMRRGSFNDPRFLAAQMQLFYQPRCAADRESRLNSSAPRRSPFLSFRCLPSVSVMLDRCVGVRETIDEGRPPPFRESGSARFRRR